MSQSLYDLFIIGGGINGCGIARDAAGRGFSVCLAEMGDLASGTSSRSTKLVHGGLRYLEHFEFRLVREALQEREVLWRMAPHLIRPLRFVLPHQRGQRPAWMLRFGLFMYDHLGGRERLPGTSMRNLTTDPLGAALKPGFSTAFEYSDCWVDDARLVVLNAKDAARLGSEILPRTRVSSVRRDGGFWSIDMIDLATGQKSNVMARMLVNAAGPWTGGTLIDGLEGSDRHGVRLVKGSHIVVPKLYDDERCFFFQNGDGRIFFAIPYEDDFTLIGTTDQDFAGDPAEVAASEGEIDYLCAAASAYFTRPISKRDVVWTYSGVRSLYDDGASQAQQATRDYVLKLSGADEPALLTVIGGKITTYRRLAEAAMERVESVLGRRGQKWTHQRHLPGGDFSVDDVDATRAQLLADYPFLIPADARRFIERYGTISWHILGTATSREAMGTHFGGGLHACEVDYLIEEEWAAEADDILWRRTKTGLTIGAEGAEQLAAYMTGRAPRGNKRSS